jgi:hypothetical protein
LILNGAHDARLAMADIDAHQLAVEVEEALAFGGPEIHPLRARDGNGIGRVLSDPFENRVFFGKSDDFVASHRCRKA